MVGHVAYYRVSTAGQGRSGLGLEAQRAAVRQFLGDAPLLAEFVEVESGKRSDRPQLVAALAAAKKAKATLVIAKLDRLARNVHLVSGLMESGVDFVAADNPHANRLTLHILAAVAEDEAKRISERTIAALAAAKARGVKLGNPKIAELAQRRKATEQARAGANAAGLDDVVRGLRSEGFVTVRQIVEQLNSRGVPTPKGGRWHIVTVHRLLKRLAGAK
jgi:DNA invertase Pin-like site-specific DNA recombinase